MYVYIINWIQSLQRAQESIKKEKENFIHLKIIESNNEPSFQQIQNI